MKQIPRMRLISKGMQGQLKGGEVVGCACCICSPGVSATGSGSFTATVSEPPPIAWDVYGGGESCLPK